MMTTASESEHLVRVGARPRALFSWAGPDKEAVRAVLSQYAPTIQDVDRLYEVRQADFDLLVTDQMRTLMVASASKRKALGPEPNLYVVSFANPANEPFDSEEGIADSVSSGTVRWHLGRLSRDVVVPDGLLPAVQDLVNEDLIPVVTARQSHLCFFLWPPPPGSVAVRAGAAPYVGDRPTPGPRFQVELMPFLLTARPESEVLAGLFRRSAVSEAWVLPADVRRPGDWVAAAIQHWAITYRRFPLVGGWWEDARWQTSAEAEATTKQLALKTRMAEVTARLEREIAVATTELEEARREAAVGLRRLLTEKGDPLKHAAADALRQLGYKVIDRDEEEPPADKGGKVEDLGGTDPDDPAVDPIIEVKGYDSGAKASDLALMLRHLTRATSTGRTPTAIWWIANHWRKRAPDDRGIVLAGEDAMIAEHASEDVPLVVIDTRDLFWAVRAVEDGRVTPADVRASLRVARGRWEGHPDQRPAE